MELILPAVYGMTGIGASGLAWMGLQSLSRTFEALDFGKQLSQRWTRPCRRAYERVAGQFNVVLDWTGADGEQVGVAARGVDISKGGFQVKARQPLTPGSVVFAHIGHFRLMGFVTVRHCAPAGKYFEIGLEYNAEPVRSDSGTWEIRRIASAEGWSR